MATDTNLTVTINGLLPQQKAAARAAGMKFYCTDCENPRPSLAADGRCSCGSGRVVAVDRDAGGQVSAR